MTVWPCDVARPDASNLNFGVGGVAANSVIAPVGASGWVCFYSNQANRVPRRHLRVVRRRDRAASPRSSAPHHSACSTPATPSVGRGSGSRRAAPSRFPLAGAALRRTDGTPVTLPADATAVAMNVTAVDTIAAGFFTVWPCGAPDARRPRTSTSPPGPSSPTVWSRRSARADRSASYSNQQSDVLVDVLGWFSSGAGQPPYTGALPQRLVDTRNGIGGPTGVLTPATPKAVAVRGVTVDVNGSPRQVPADASAVALNVTMVDARAGRLRDGLAVRHADAGRLERQLRSWWHRRRTG